MAVSTHTPHHCSPLGLGFAVPSTWIIPTLTFPIYNLINSYSLCKIHWGVTSSRKLLPVPSDAPTMMCSAPLFCATYDNACTMHM